MTDLVIATGNKGKLREIARLLEGSRFRVLGMDAFPDVPEVVEDGDSFAANACKKAAIVAAHTGSLTLADDSGLMVEALGGEPGIRSARYAGENATDADNNRKLLDALEGVPSEQRQAAFHCVMALAMPGEDCRFFEGELRGVVLNRPRGDSGFGYDPLFLVPQFGRSLAELPLDLKNRISHRGQALQKVLAALGG